MLSTSAATPNTLMTRDSSANTAVNVLTANSIILPNGTLNYYEEYNYTTTFSGPLTTAAITFKIIRVGKSVTLTEITPRNPPFATTTNANYSFFKNDTALPSRFCPVNTASWWLSFPIVMLYGPTAQTPELGHAQVGYNGVINLNRLSTRWVVGEGASWMPLSLSWNVA
jgi:hypothetical protein